MDKRCVWILFSIWFSRHWNGAKASHISPCSLQRPLCPELPAHIDPGRVDEGDAVDDVPAELGVDNVARRIHHQTQSVRFVVFPEAEVGFEGQSLEDAEALPLVGFVDFSVVFAVQLMNGVKGERRPLMRLRCILQLFNGVLPRRLLFYGVH